MPKRMSHIKVWVCAGVFCILICSWIAGFFLFVAGIPKEMRDDVYLVDVVVVLTGGSKRLETGFQLTGLK